MAVQPGLSDSRLCVRRVAKAVAIAGGYCLVALPLPAGSPGLTSDPPATVLFPLEECFRGRVLSMEGALICNDKG
jgi:hypothetical protein